ncbi:unnamed protein product [Somion occarium]|uniref:J domain-containing protein n=1 Tax=Somion occarium TaxID=3059160 RepID=A0ABP1EC60_9APHY
MNYYTVLDLPKGASEEEIRAAYKKLALKWHPDRHMDDKEDAQEKFIEISHAYNSLLDALHHPRKHKHRDRDKKNDTPVPPPPPPSSSGSSESHSSSSDSPSSKHKEDRDGKDKRSEERNARQRDPMPKASSSSSSRKPSVRTKAHHPRTTFFPHFHSDSSSDESDDDSIHHHRGTRLKKPRHLEDEDYEFVDLGSPLQPLSSPKSTPDISKDWVFPLPLSLEDLCSGASHRYRVTRTLRSGKAQNVKIDIKVSPGWRKGTRVRVPGVGNERKDGTFQDIVFVVEEQSHSRFTRVDNDLLITVQVPWADSSSRPYSWSSVDSDLNGELRPPREEMAFVKGVDGEEFALPIPRSLVEGADGSRIVGAGMPIRSHGRVDGRGDLVVRWEFVFPETDKAQQSRWQALTKAMKWK